MRILWMSDSPDTPSGFGNVTRFVCAGLARLGHNVSILGWQTRQAFDWCGCRVHANGSDPMGSDALFVHLTRHRPEVVIALADVWWLPYFGAPHVRRQMELTRTPWLLYFPVDGDTKDERLPESWCELLREVDVPIAMSRYGQRVAARCGIACEYIPHGVDLDIFTPPADRDEAKARVGARGKFLVLSDSRNQPRKMIPRLLDIFARFAAGRPDALLHLHTDPNDQFTRSVYYSYDVRADVHHLGLESQVRFSPGFTVEPGGGLPLHELAAYYQAADVHLLASSGEGFGLPTLQAAAAGAIPMASAYSASQELVEGHGEAIAIEDWSENEFGIRRVLIDGDDAVAKLVRFYNDRGLLREQSARARAFALSYGWQQVVASWDSLLHAVVPRKRGPGGAPRRAAAPAERVVERVLPSVNGASIRVKTVERTFWRLETSIAADARRHQTDVRMPFVPPAAAVNHVRVPRRAGYVGLAAGDRAIFAALKRLFPILNGWVAHFDHATAEPEANDCQRDSGWRTLTAEDPEEARFELAQTVLLLNVSGTLPEALLHDAALFGALCVGTSLSPAQREFWPELAVDLPADAVALARAVLTNSARAARLVRHAQHARGPLSGTEADEMVRSLRRQHQEQRSGTGSARG
jgi:glycosyltransferase involved in cell wall biosynthesis